MPTPRLATTAALILIGATCLAPAASRAQQTASGTTGSSAVVMPSFEQLDKANHGYLTRGDIPKDIDALKPLRMHFAESDSNGNGRIEKAEYEAFVARSQPGQAGGKGN